MKENAQLFLVPTPIGNLEDITLRALRILREVELILAEDTRTTSKLLKHHKISNRIQSYHAFNEHRVTEQIIQLIQSGKRIALVTDAGTPGISDPGYLLVNACINRKIPIECLPGPTALIPALINSGLPNDRFTFEGFLPHKKGRKSHLESLRNEKRTMIFYESPFRLKKCIGELIEIFEPSRRISVSRELTKKFEETINGTLSDLYDYFAENPVKGEIVIIVEGKKQNSDPTF